MLLRDHPITHGGITFADDPSLGGARVRGQSAIRYLRFGRTVDLSKVEFPTHFARWEPTLPYHPAHVIVQTLDPSGRRWTTIRDVNFEPDPRVWGEGLPADATNEQRREFFALTGSRPSHVLDMTGVTTDCLRVVCDREHPVYPSHGECNGPPFNAPFGILDRVQAHGTPHGEVRTPAYLPRLRVAEMNPAPPRGMKIGQSPGLLTFEGPEFAVSFSLDRPVIRRLAWDALGRGGASRNRLMDARRYSDVVGLSGPHLRTPVVDALGHGWTGSVSVSGSRVTYHDLDCDAGLKIDAAFDVFSDGIRLELTTHCERDIPAIEFETWRLVFQLRDHMTAATALPTQIEGRNGQVRLPMLWAGDGVGALSCRVIDGQDADALFQVESYRNISSFAGNGATFLSGGLMPATRGETADSCDIIPAGTRRGAFEWRVTAFEPDSPRADSASVGIRAHWGSIFSCFRPELAGFSNQAASTNCHVNQHAPLEVVPLTRRPEHGPDPIELLRFTIERGIMNGRGYGYYRSLYLDADPILVCGAGRLHQVRPDAGFLRRIEPGFRTAVQRMLSTIGEEGLSICRTLSGDSSSFRWSSNAMDIIGFGHMDAYVNAYTYRALRNAAPMFRALGDASMSKRCDETAVALRAAFAKYLLNPETGWVAGWRSRDGRLHDYAFLYVNGPALAFGLLDPQATRTALTNLETLRQRVGATSAAHGLPCNLLPIRYEDHMLPQIRGALISTFESSTDGAMMPSFAGYYMRALSANGFKQSAARIAADLDSSFAAGHFTGGTDSGCEFLCWDGMASGYEGTFVCSFAPLYAVAIEQGLIQPFEPEWWPTDV